MRKGRVHSLVLCGRMNSARGEEYRGEDHSAIQERKRKRGMGQGRLRLTVHREEEDGERVRRNETRVKEKNKGCMRSEQCERKMNGGGKKKRWRGK